MSAKSFHDLLGTQYELYLEIMGLRKETMPEDQLRETRRAFMGACGQMLSLLKDDLTKIEDEDEAARILEGMENQVLDFFKAEEGER